MAALAPSLLQLGTKFLLFLSDVGLEDKQHGRASFTTSDRMQSKLKVNIGPPKSFSYTLAESITIFGGWVLVESHGTYRPVTKKEV